LALKDCCLIKALQIEKGWPVDRIISEFPAKQWKTGLVRTFSQIFLKDFAVNFIFK